MIANRTANVLEFPTILQRLAEKTVSEAGYQKALNLRASTDRSTAERMMRETAEAETLLIRRPHYPLRSFDSVYAELKRLAMGADLNGLELLRLNSVYKAAKLAKESVCSEEEDFSIKQYAGDLYFEARVIREVDEAILSETEIADSASQTLYTIRKKIRSEHELIREQLQKMIKSKEYQESLQDSIITQRNGRYVVPVKQEYRSNVAGLVHAQSGSGATLFIEPMSVVEANNRISELQAAEQAEIERILARLSAYFRPHIEEITHTFENLAQLDLIFAKASLGIEMKAVPVTFSEGLSLNITDGRHPLIAKEEVVPLSVYMSEQSRMLIISGPNTGGKTVTLKMCGLFALMAQSGLFLPARSGVCMPVFEHIFADIGDEQSISQSLSTFSSHMKNIIDILKKTAGKSFVLLDEIGAGTEPQEGAAIAMAVLDHLYSAGALTIATTHYSDLKAFAAQRDGFENASMEFDAVALKPTFRLQIGTPGMSNALLIARRLGLQESVLQKAGEFLSEEHTRFSELIADAHKTAQEAEEQKTAAEKMRREAQKMLDAAQEESARSKEKSKKQLQRASEQALEILSDAKDDAEKLIAEAKKIKKQSLPEQTKSIQHVRGSFDRKKERLRKTLNTQQRRGRALSAQEIQAGMDVRVVSLDVPATVLKEPNAKGMVQVMAGIMKLEIPIGDLESTQAAKKQQAQRTSSVTLNRQRRVSSEIDLHGQAVDDALILLDKYLDDAFISGLTQVSIIHGRGTGTLRKGVRAYLAHHPHVKSTRTGQYGEGGDGVTVVELK